MAKSGKYIRMSDEAEQQLSEMVEVTGRNQTEIIQDAIGLLYRSQGDEIGSVREVAIGAPLRVLREIAAQINSGDEFDKIGTAVQLQAVPTANGLAFAMFIDPAILESEAIKLAEWWQKPLCEDCGFRECECEIST